MSAVLVLADALADELPELDAARVRAAVERAAARVAVPEALWERLVDVHAARVTTSAEERAATVIEVDDDGALDHHLADALEGGPEELDALIRRCGEREALAALERFARTVTTPVARARVLHRAAEIAWRFLDDADAAHELLVRARADDPDLGVAVDALAALHRERGELAGAVELLVEAAARPALSAERSRLLREAAELSLVLGDRDRATALYCDARACDPSDLRTAEALAELYDAEGDVAELVPVLDQLCRAIEHPGTLRRHLLRLGAAAAALGDTGTARDALVRAVSLDPGDPAPRQALVDLLFERGVWAEARGWIEELLDDREDLLPPALCVELHYRAARCARNLGDDPAAARHAAIALALDPGFRPALLLCAELDADDPSALVASHLALAQTASAEEKASRFAAIGDLYAERLDDPAAAREMYREALVYRPTDHLLLTKSLGLVAGQGDWAYSLDLLQRLIDSERAPAMRARYRHVAAMISRDELGRAGDAAALLGLAIDDDPALFAAADELEALLAAAPDPEPLVVFYYRRLEQLRQDEGRAGELLRLWDRLGALCFRTGRRDDAVCALQVGVTLEPDDVDRRERLAELYAESGPAHFDDAIVQHQILLRSDRRRTASYQALGALYRQTGQPEKAEACDQALAVLAAHASGATGELGAAPPRTVAFTLDASDWPALAHPEVDLLLSALFTLVAPAFAAERGRIRSARRRLPLGLLSDEDPRPIARAVHRVVTLLGIERPTVMVDHDQAAIGRIVLHGRDGALVPILVLGRAALDDAADERMLTFALARRMADLRADRVARLLCLRTAELIQMIEVAAVLASDHQAGTTALAHTVRWLARTLHPTSLDQVTTLGARVRERGLDPIRAALGWLEATERAADRVGLLATGGDLLTCVRALESEPAASSSREDRILELVRSSVTEEMFAVRRRVEGWTVVRGAEHPADRAITG